MGAVNDELRDKVIDRVRKRLRLPQDSTSSLLYDIEDRAEEVEQEMLNYLNRSDIPEGLFFAWVRMVEAVIKSEITDSDEVDDLNAASVTAIKEGDSSVNFGGGSTASTSISIGNALRTYTSELNRYRRMTAPTWRG